MRRETEHLSTVQPTADAHTAGTSNEPYAYDPLIVQSTNRALRQNHEGKLFPYRILEVSQTHFMLGLAADINCI